MAKAISAARRDGSVPFTGTRMLSLAVRRIVEQAVARIGDDERSVEARRELGDVGVESGVVADRGLVEPDDEKVVALLGLFGDDLGFRCRVGNDGDVELCRRAAFFLRFASARRRFDLLGGVLDVMLALRLLLGALLGVFFGFSFSSSCLPWLS